MSLDIHLLEYGKPGKLLHQIETGSYARLYAMFEFVETRTGTLISEHKDTFLKHSFSHIILLMFEYMTKENDMHVRQEIAGLLSVLINAESKHQSVDFLID